MVQKEEGERWFKQMFMKKSERKGVQRRVVCRGEQSVQFLNTSVLLRDGERISQYTHSK